MTSFLETIHLSSILFLYLGIEGLVVLLIRKVIYPYANRRTKPKECRGYERKRHLLLIRIMDRMKRTLCDNADGKTNDDGDHFESEFRKFLQQYFKPHPPPRHGSGSPNPKDTGTDTDMTLYQGNVDDFMAWGFFSKKVEDLVDWEREEMEYMIRIIRDRYGVTYPPGKNECVRGCLMNVDDCNHVWKPIWIYLGVILFSLLGKGMLYMIGFRCFTSKTGLRYWYRPEQDSLRQTSLEKPLPFLFFHGIAPGGFTVYLPMVLKGLCNDGRACFLFENPGISFSCSLQALTEDETISGVTEALDRHLGPKACVCMGGHSFGSCQMAWLVSSSSLSHRIQHMVFIDPVSILLCYPDTLVNFLYRPPGTFMYKMSSDVFLQHYLRRNVAWYNSELFMEDVPDHIQLTVCLADQDDIVSAKNVRKEIEITNQIRQKEAALSSSSSSSSSSSASSPQEKGRRTRSVDMIYWNDNTHGTCLFTPSNWDDMKKTMMRQDYRYNKALKLE